MSTGPRRHRMLPESRRCPGIHASLRLFPRCICVATPSNNASKTVRARLRIQQRDRRLIELAEQGPATTVINRYQPPERLHAAIPWKPRGRPVGGAPRQHLSSVCSPAAVPGLRPPPSRAASTSAFALRNPLPCSCQVLRSQPSCFASGRDLQPRWVCAAPQ